MPPPRGRAAAAAAARAPVPRPPGLAPSSPSPSGSASPCPGLGVPVGSGAGQRSVGGGPLVLASHRLLLRHPRHQLPRSSLRRVRHAASAAGAGCAAGVAPWVRAGLLLAGLGAGGPGRPDSGPLPGRTASPKMPVELAPAGWWSSGRAATAGSRAGGDVMVMAGGKATGGSLASHRLFCLHPPHHRSLCSLRRVRHAAPRTAGLLPPPPPGAGQSVGDAVAAGGLAAGGALAVAAAGSFASHRLLRLHPPHHCSFGRRARHVLPRLAGPLSSPAGPAVSSGGRSPSMAGSVAGAPGAPASAPAPSGAAAAARSAGRAGGGRRKSHPRWLRHPLHHRDRSSPAVLQARGSGALGGGPARSPPVPMSVPAGSVRAGATSPPPLEAVCTVASAPRSVSAGPRGGGGVGAGGAWGGGPGSGVRSWRAAML